ncbi:TadE-like protein [Pseudovibrio axinellae]|uniref:TadE-like protein n=1 Tax=Pseudovibrio axinellae TaxID=989403 RepID=A0A166B7C7_9HYPH|nr:TadE/TadG family type IV pilus assembly protein [Pseudovibrio axinellae]KZL21981.1 TadE-like protein [Pseudovibrio axinellae]SEQ59883.1 TadE-like protein [Pseudovibrio axinellae]
MKLHPKHTKRVGCFLRNAAGAAAIEFAFVLPVLLFLFIGMVEMTSALSHDRRVSKTAFSIADLVARSDNVTGEMADIEAAIAHLMTPYEDAQVEVSVGMVVIRSNVPEVVWSWGNETDEPWAQGTEPEGVAFANTMRINDQYYVVSTVNFDYTFMLGQLMSNFSELLTDNAGDFTSISLSDSFILLPRRVSCVEFGNTCATY